MFVDMMKKVHCGINLQREIFKRYRESGFSNGYLRRLKACTEENVWQKVNFIELGEENSGSTIGVIKLASDWIPTAGFFALLHRLLCGLYFADRLGLIPVADAWVGCAYEEQIPVNGSRNVFEYYYEPLSDITMQSALNSQNVVRISDFNMDLVFLKYHCEWFNMSETFINEMGRLYKKYIRFNEATREKLDTDVLNILQKKKTLGIHFRGTDYAVGAVGHPVALSIEDYFYYMDYALEHFSFEQIFVATDDAGALRKLKERYSNIICYDDVLRAEGKVSVAFLKRENMELPKYRAGYEVIRDTYTLSLCDGLIVGQSQVSTNARILRAASDKPFDYSTVLTKGILRKGVDWREEFKKLKI